LRLAERDSLMTFLLREAGHNDTQAKRFHIVAP
jgi:hypothetical protein